jgi:stearoyl-CoA desaturase (delta-9 desaturase)
MPEKLQPAPPKPRKLQIVWLNVALFVVLHVGAVYGVYLFFAAAKWLTWLWVIFLYAISGLGITAGAHRLWSHRSYKATFPAKVLLVIFDTVALQNDIIEWARDHRVHHKYSETDADPHNALRGFFFSHIGWLLVRKHPDVKDKGSKLDVSDLQADPILRFQKKYYKTLAILACFVVPTVVPALWNESLHVAYFTAALMRYCLVLHATWSINSIAHMFGNRPYDKLINPRQNILCTLMSVGEGWHNYHHTFPYDYKASEWGWRVNFTTVFIDFLAWLGWAYDRKAVNQESIERQKLKHGENHHQHDH